MFLNNYLCYNTVTARDLHNQRFQAEKKPIEEQVDCNIDINIFC